MKEATGELNSTVITVIAVATFVVFFFSYLWPLISSTFEFNSKCSDAICENCDGNDCETVTCHLKDDEKSTFECVYKG